VIVGAIGAIAAIDGVPRWLGWTKRGFLSVYRDPAADRWSRFIPVATPYVAMSLLGLVALMVAASSSAPPVVGDALACMVFVSGVAAVVTLRRGPWYLLPPWAARLARDGWSTYWGDAADRDFPRAPARWQARLVVVVGVAAAAMWLVVSPGLEKVWPLGFGIAGAIAVAAKN